MTLLLACVLAFLPLREPHPVGEAVQMPPDTSSVHGTVTGLATWYQWPRGHAAAGPGLRKALGKHWRGKTVTVYAHGRHVRVILNDWCACGKRHGKQTLIDLSIYDAKYLRSTGVLPVKIGY